AVTVTDNNGLSSTQPITVTITGTNDAPVLAADSGVDAFTETAGITGSAAADSVSGLLTFSDVDLSDSHVTSQAAPSFVWSGGGLSASQIAALTSASTLALSESDSTGSGAGSIGFSYSAADRTFDFLAAGQTLTVVYAVTVTDNNGLSSTQPITVTITGTNDAPVLAADSGVHAFTETAGITGSAAADSVSGLL